jgi:integrase
MASVHKEKNGFKVQFMPLDQRLKRQALRLGPVTRREADEVKAQVERILASRKAGLTLEERSQKWIAKLPERLRHQLVKKGVIEDGGRRVRSTLSGFIADYLADRTGITSGTRQNLQNARDWLTEYFGAEREMDSITPDEAGFFREWLGSDEKLAENTIRGICRKSRQLFRSAVGQRVIGSNPFSGMKNLMDLPSPKARNFFISQSLAEEVLAACPDDEWRLIFALARYGGLRCPSELVTLKWSDIDWKKGRFVVYETKRKRHVETRETPLFPELRPFLETCFRAKDRDPIKVIKRVHCTKNNLRTQMGRILERASIKQWPKLFQNLRSTRETELVQQGHPVHVVCTWLGNTPKVAEKHYLQVTDEDFQRALLRCVPDQRAG